MVNMTGVIKARKICDIYVRKENNLSDQVMTDVRKHLAKRLSTMKRKLLATNPVLYPPGKLPIAAKRYKPMLITGKQSKVEVNPGRLRRSTANGVRWTGGSGLRGLSPTGTRKVIVSWGLDTREYGGGDLPYGAWVAKMPGTATGGGIRYQWDIMFRRWLSNYIKKQVEKTNHYYKLGGNDRLFFRKASKL